MGNSSDPNSVKADFEALQNRFRRTGVEGVKMAEGETKRSQPHVDTDKDFEQRKNAMTTKGGAAVFNAIKKSVPNARPRQGQGVSRDSEVRVFAVGEKKSEEDKEK